MTAVAKKPKIGDALVSQGAITAEQLTHALAEQRASGRMLGQILVEQGTITGSTFVSVLGTTLGVPGVHLRHGLVDPALMKLIGEEEAERLLAVPMFKVKGTLTVAMAEPQSLPTIDRLAQLTGCRIRPVLALEANVREYVKKFAGGEVNVDAFLSTLTEQQVEVVEKEAIDEGPLTDLEKMVAGSPIINLVNVAFMTAIRDKASDIHVEPDKKGTRIRYRIDGVLRDLMKPPSGMHGAVVSRIKVIATKEP